LGRATAGNFFKFGVESSNGEGRKSVLFNGKLAAYLKYSLQGFNRVLGS